MASIDTSANRRDRINVIRAPQNALAVTKSDTDTFSFPVEIYVGGAGVVNCLLLDGTQVAFTVPAGGKVPVEVKGVMSTSTTATLMVAYW